MASLRNFTARVVKVKPNTEHQGIVIDQEVIIELNNLQRISLFDPDKIANTSLEGKYIKLEAFMNSAHPAKNENKEFLINQDTPMHILVKGRIVEIIKPDRYLGDKVLIGILDCGSAVFSFSLSPEDRLDVGDYVTFPSEGNRLDLIKFEVIN